MASQKYEKKKSGSKDKVTKKISGNRQARRSASSDAARSSLSNSSQLYSSQTNVNQHSDYEIDMETIGGNDESGVDEESLFNTMVFKNNNKSIYAPVRQLFKISKLKKNGRYYYEGICSLCEHETVIKLGNNSDLNLRSHLAFIHGRTDLLTDGQKNRNNRNETFNLNDKKEIDAAVLSCIQEDSRPFNDFCKPGMRRLFQFIKPGYKPMSKQTIRKRLKSK